jgi:endonuclease/exonuclease/phosphatase (EEP) superfamily protein YafD
VAAGLPEPVGSRFADLLDALAREKHPVIVGGDFTFTEETPNAAALGRLGLLDAHSVGGQGRGTTWPVNAFFRWIPGLRFDPLYLGGGLTCADCRTGIGEGSDHRPLLARIGFRR